MSLEDETANSENIEYDSSTRLQSGFAVPSSLQDWQDKKKINKYKKPEWRWILTPALDRFGQQPVFVEGVVYGSNGKIVTEARPVKILVNVQTPLGLPSWVGYGLITFAAILALPLFAWLWEIIKDRYFKHH